MKKILLFILLFSTLVGAQPAKQTEEAHNQLRTMKDQCVKSLNAGDFDSVIHLADEEVLFTAMDSRLAHGRAELKAYLEKMTKGPDKVVESFQTEVEVDRLTTLYGPDFGVASGTSLSHYKLTDGSDFAIKNRWTATVVHKNGQWLLASFHSSANVFDNPILDLAKKYAMRLALGSGLIGLLLGLLVGRLMGRKS